MVQGLKLALAPLAWRILEAGLRLEDFPDHLLAAGHPLILCCLHRDILPTIMHVKPARPALLVSPSPDGDILVRTLGHRNYCFVRGATGEGGTRAFMGLARQLREGRSVGVAIDGPKGPFGAIHDGVFQLARLTGAPIMPLVAQPARFRRLGTWDRTVVPGLFTKVHFVHGPLLHLPRQSGLEEIGRARSSLARFFGVEEEAP